MQTKRNSNNGCITWFVALAGLLAILVLPALLLGHPFGFLPSVGAFFSQGTISQDTNVNRMYPHLFLRFVAADVAMVILVVCVAMIAVRIRRGMRSAAQSSSTRQPPQDRSVAVEPVRRIEPGVMSEVAETDHEPDGLGPLSVVEADHETDAPVPLPVGDTNHEAADPVPVTALDADHGADMVSVTEAAHDETAAPIALPEMCVSESWPDKPGMTLEITLGALPVNDDPAERAYELGLQALAEGDAQLALTHLREVVSVAGWATTAQLLVLLLSAKLGDATTVAALHEACVTVAQPDRIASKAIRSSQLLMWATASGVEPSITVEGFIDQPAAAAQLALASGALVVQDRERAAAALEDMDTVRKLRDEAWAAQEKIVKAERDQNVIALVHQITGKDLLTASPDWVAVQMLNHFGTRERQVAKIDAMGQAPKDPVAPRGPAGSIAGLPHTLCQIYEALDDADGVLRTLNRWTFDEDQLFKAWALARKGHSGAALQVYDDMIKQSAKDGTRRQYLARYRKARLLINLGDPVRARRELDRLYADEPLFNDEAGLLALVSAAKTTKRREPIPEHVRAEVWRRDEGRCVECGSQERLEFDHIIPISKGGANTVRNLQLLCESCNRSKGARI